MAERKNPTPTAEPEVKAQAEPEVHQAAPVIPAPTPAVPKTEEELIQELLVCQAANDWQGVARISKLLAGRAEVAKKAEHEAKVLALGDLTARIKVAIEKAIGGFLEEIEVKGGQGIWFAYEFGELNDKSVRLLKSAPAPKKSGSTSSGSGGGAKSPLSTPKDLLPKYGGEESGIDGLTFQELFDQRTDQNTRYYKVRLPLLVKAEADGLTPS